MLPDILMSLFSLCWPADFPGPLLLLPMDRSHCIVLPFPAFHAISVTANMRASPMPTNALHSNAEVPNLPFKWKYHDANDIA